MKKLGIVVVMVALLAIAIGVTSASPACEKMDCRYQVPEDRQLASTGPATTDCRYLLIEECDAVRRAATAKKGLVVSAAEAAETAVVAEKEPCDCDKGKAATKPSSKKKVAVKAPSPKNSIFAGLTGSGLLLIAILALAAMVITAIAVRQHPQAYPPYPPYPTPTPTPTPTVP